MEALGSRIEKMSIKANAQQKSIPLTSAKSISSSGAPKAVPSNPGHDGYELNPETYRDWIVNVTLEKFALGGSGSVDFFGTQ